LGKKDHASALDWAKEGAYDPGNKKYNDYDWGDARKHYKNGNKSMAYKCLGHVCHLLQDMSVPGHTIPSIKDGEDGIKKGYPPLPHGKYEAFIYLNDDGGEKFLEEPTSIIEKKSLDEFFKGIAKESRKFGDR
jgi:hypothetical protein